MVQMNSGPAPKDPEKRARRNKPPTAAVTLPREGRTAPAPDWPIGDGPFTDMEAAVWEDLWTYPQAVMWERLHSHREVAQYVHFACTRTTASADMERRQLADRLGLNPLAMRRLGWELPTDAAAVVTAERPARNVADLERYKGLRAVERS